MHEAYGGYLCRVNEQTLEGLLAGYGARIHIPVHWGEMDALGHVNNTVYLRYLESTRIRFCEELDYPGFDPAQMGSAAAPYGPILAQITCRYKFPVTYPDTLVAGTRYKTGSLHTYGFELEHILVSMRHLRIAAASVAGIVVYNYTELRKAEVPELLRKKLLAMENA